MDLDAIRRPPGGHIPFGGLGRSTEEYGYDPFDPSRGRGRARALVPSPFERSSTTHPHEHMAPPPGTVQLPPPRSNAFPAQTSHHEKHVAPHHRPPFPRTKTP